MAKRYEINPKYRAEERLLTLIEGQRINLTGKDYTCTSKETKHNPSEEIVFKGATQKHLKAYYANPNQKIVVFVNTQDLKKIEETEKVEGSK